MPRGKGGRVARTGILDHRHHRRARHRHPGEPDRVLVLAPTRVPGRCGRRAPGGPRANDGGARSPARELRAGAFARPDGGLRHLGRDPARADAAVHDPPSHRGADRAAPARRLTRTIPTGARAAAAVTVRAIPSGCPTRSPPRWPACHPWAGNALSSRLMTSASAAETFDPSPRNPPLAPATARARSSSPAFSTATAARSICSHRP